MRPSGGVMARSGIISRTPSNPQKEGGKLGHTMRTLTSDPRGGKVTPWDLCAAVGGGVGMSAGTGAVEGCVLGRTLSLGSCKEGPFLRCHVSGAKVSGPRRWNVLNQAARIRHSGLDSKYKDTKHTDGPKQKQVAVGNAATMCIRVGG